MALKFLSPDKALRLVNNSMNPYRPKEIIDLKEAIKTEIRVAELRASVTGVIDYEQVGKIVEMKLELDWLYASWA